MIGAITGLITALASGAGGGLLGGIFGLFKQSQERKERVEMARIAAERDRADYANAAEERAHALAILEATGKIELQKIETEADAEAEVVHQMALGSAHDALKNLKTTSGMDNYRASIRPTLALWFTGLFSVMLAWAFWKFADTITPADGKALLLGLFATLEFLVTSVGTFYYVARRNHAPRV